MRSFLAILLGYGFYLVGGLLLHARLGPPGETMPGPGVLAITLAVGLGTGLGGGWLAAMAAPKHPVGHAGGVAGLIVLGALVAIVSQWGAVATWSHVATIGLYAPAALVGGLLRAPKLGEP